eukprot:m.22995 g.22995  ORF g.22995 m.22995 type:complete len:714 (-) comp3836_c0_seq2:59-2200(-)
MAYIIPSNSKIPAAAMRSGFDEEEDGMMYAMNERSRLLNSRGARTSYEIPSAEYAFATDNPADTEIDLATHYDNFVPNPAHRFRDTSDAAAVMRQSRRFRSSVATDPFENDPAIVFHEAGHAYETVELIRSFAMPLADKRILASQYRDECKRRMSTWQLAWYAFVMHAQHAKLWLQDTLRWMFWGARIARIEGEHGTLVASAFVLLRWLLLLNVFYSVILGGLLAVPQIVGNGAGHGQFAMRNLLMGDGVFETSVLFEGFYSVVPDFDMPMGYACTLMALCFLTVLLLLRAMSRQFSDRQAMMGRTSLIPFSLLALSELDHTIRSPVAMETQRKAIANRLRELYHECKRKDGDGRSRVARARIWLRRIAINALITLILAFAMAGIYSLTQTYADSASGIEALYPAIVLAILNAFLPVCFQTLGDYENYDNPATHLQMNLLRSFVVRITGIYVVIVSLYNLSNTVNGNTCWETAIGQGVYRLLLIDTLSFILSTLCASAIHKLVYHGFSSDTTVQASDKKIPKNRLQTAIGPPLFNLPKNILSVIYRQALVWVGMFFCPALPLLSCLYAYGIVWTLESTLKRFVDQPDRLFRVSNATSFYMLLLLITYFLSAGPVLYIVLTKTPSPDCSPFRGTASVLAVLGDRVDGMPTGLRDVVDFLFSAGFAVPLVAFLFSLLYYYWRVAASQQAFISFLYIQLRKERDFTRTSATSQRTE